MYTKKLFKSLKVLPNPGQNIRAVGHFYSPYNNIDFISHTTCFDGLNHILSKRFKFQTQGEKISKKNFKYLLRSKSFDQNLYVKMSNPTVNYFAHSFIDRCADRRKDSNWINQKLTENGSVFVLFHVDKPFVCVKDSEKMYSLCKFNYSQIKTFLDAKCVYVFLGLEYMKNSGKLETISPYSCAKSYDRSNSKAWFVIETSGFDTDIERVSSLFSDQGKFFEGNFLRLMAIQDLHESSIIAQVRLEKLKFK